GMKGGELLGALLEAGAVFGDLGQSRFELLEFLAEVLLVALEPAKLGGELLAASLVANKLALLGGQTGAEFGLGSGDFGSFGIDRAELVSLLAERGGELAELALEFGQFAAALEHAGG